MRRTQLTDRRTTGGKRGERNKLFKITSHGGMTRVATVTFKRTAVLFVVVGLCLVSGTWSDQKVPPVHHGEPAAVPNGPQELRSREDEGSDAFGDSTSPEEKCEDGWKFLDEACYLFETCTLNWNLAKQACEKAGAQLLVINSIAEYNAVKGEMEKFQQRAKIWYWWIGLQRNAASGSATSGWQWVDQSPLSEYFPKWRKGEPNNYKGNETCAVIQYSGHMNDLNCDLHTLPYICEKVPKLLSSSFWLSTTSMTVDDSTMRNKDDEHDNYSVDNSTARNKDDEHGDCPPRIAIIASEVAVGLVIIVINVVLILVKRRRGTQSGETVPPAFLEIRTVALPEDNQGPRPNQEEAAESYESMLMDEVGQRSVYTTYSSHRKQPAPRVMSPQKDHQEEEIYENT